MADEPRRRPKPEEFGLIGIIAKDKALLLAMGIATSTEGILGRLVAMRMFASRFSDTGFDSRELGLAQISYLEAIKHFVLANIITADEEKIGKASEFAFALHKSLDELDAEIDELRKELELDVEDH